MASESLPENVSCPPGPKSEMGRILVVEDEPSIRDSIVYALESEGFDVDCVATGSDALAMAQSNDYALIVLDVGLPDQSGFDVCQHLRRTSVVPVIFLTARDSEVDRVVGLELGADDYVTKPFSPRELSARVRANVRRTKMNALSKKAIAKTVGNRNEPFSIDYDRLIIRFFGEALVLSRYEFRLLAVLVERPGRVFTRAQLMDAAWEEPDASMERTVDTHVKSLRAKLKVVQPSKDPILTHRGIGYSMNEVW